MALLLKATGVAHDQRSQLEGDSRGVAFSLQSHPLALIQAGAYVGRGHCTLAECPKVYERQRKRLSGSGRYKLSHDIGTCTQRLKRLWRSYERARYNRRGMH
jgi:hypothetical protein